MSDEEAEFGRWMDQVGVRPLGADKSAHQQKLEQEQKQSESDAEREFEEAMARFMAEEPGASQSLPVEADGDVSAEKSPQLPASSAVADAVDPGAEMEFELAMQQLGSIRDKDASDAAQGRVSKDSMGVTWEQVPRRSLLPVDDRLDLHGMTQPEALQALTSFVRECALAGCKRVCIITGKGMHSPEGRSVIRPLAESWLLGDGARYVDKIAEASRYQGGRGALIVWLKTVAE